MNPTCAADRREILAQLTRFATLTRGVEDNARYLDEFADDATLLPPERRASSGSRAIEAYYEHALRSVDTARVTYDDVAIDLEGATTNPEDAELVGGNAFVPNVGVSYEVVPGLHPYASYSKAFKGQFASRLADGAKADPEEGEQYEIGVKVGLFENRINTTISAYQLTRSNVLQPDFLNPGFYTLTGEQRSRGFEFDGQFLVTPNWEIVASLAYTDAEVTKDFAVPVGSTLRNVPREAISLWSKYRFQDGPLRGLAVSLGGSYYGRQQGKDVVAPTEDPSDIESFYLPSYTLLAANINYDWGKTRFALILNNLLDEDYYSGSFDEYSVLPGAPRSVRFSVGWSL